MTKKPTARAATWIMAALTLSGPALADRTDDLIAQFQAARANGDVAAARRALQAAEVELTTSPKASPFASSASSPATAPQTGRARSAAPGTAQPTATAAPGRTSPQPLPEATKNLFERLQVAGFRLQQSPGPSTPDSGSATFAFDNDVEAGTETNFQANFFLGWSSAAVKQAGIDPITGVPRSVPRGSSGFRDLPNLTWYWDTSVQGKLSSGDDTATDAWRFRIGVDLDHASGRYMADSRSNEEILEDYGARGLTDAEAQVEIRRRDAQRGSPFYLGSWWTIEAKLEADRDFENQRLSGEVQVTPTTSMPGNGIWYPRDTSVPVQFIWRPYFGIDAGGMIASNGALDAVDDTLRGVGRLTATLSLNFLARALGLPNVKLTADDTLRYLTESGDAYNYLSSQLTFGLTEDVSFALTYVNGEDSPTFQRQERFGGALSVKF